MGIEKDKEFLMFRNNYRKEIFVQYFMDREINKDVNISEKELVNYYYANKEKFRIFETATVCVFRFESLQCAFDSLRMLIDLQAKLSGRTEKYRDRFPKNVETMQVDLRDLSIDSNLAVVISKTEPRRFSKPFRLNDECVFIYVDDEYGQTYIPLKYVRREIEEKLFRRNQNETSMTRFVTKEHV